ncbi:hypothetical protein PROFUN_02162 [Planoprotostelium fungivorum]|uniref:Uncharacterized protein n=1 Tax=Planoprotostelium fungivorum TaxID=1890364 RepID=A0A2P6NZE2_9EUKA|nr:hypothetical protein PROFUN_02162 [Planoprotostelium fungivorum]
MTESPDCLPSLEDRGEISGAAQNCVKQWTSNVWSLLNPDAFSELLRAVLYSGRHILITSTAARTTSCCSPYYFYILLCGVLKANRIWMSTGTEQNLDQHELLMCTPLRHLIKTKFRNSSGSTGNPHNFLICLCGTSTCDPVTVSYTEHKRVTLLADKNHSICAPTRPASSSRCFRGILQMQQLTSKYELLLQGGDIEWEVKEWNLLVETILHDVQSRVPPSNSYSTSRILIYRESDTVEDFQPVCFLYRGRFLPSGETDGLVWKPSRGAVMVGGTLWRRYHYATFKGEKFKRQVSFLNPESEWCIVEYAKTNSSTTVIRLSELKILPDCDFRLIVTMVARNLIDGKLPAKAVPPVAPPPSSLGLFFHPHPEERQKLTPSPPIMNHVVSPIINTSPTVPDRPMHMFPEVFVNDPFMQHRNNGYHPVSIIHPTRSDQHRALSVLSLELKEALRLAHFYNQKVIQLNEEYLRLLNHFHTPENE